MIVNVDPSRPLRDFAGCTPATPLEVAAWDTALPRGRKVAERAVVGADPNPRIQIWDTTTGQVYSVNRGEMDAALRNNPTYIPATPAQITAWKAALKAAEVAP